MHNKHAAIALLALFALLGLFGCEPNESKEQANGTEHPSQSPNILLIITDDQGYGDLGFTGNKQLSTPSIDDLFTQGVSFNRFYVSPVCAPTRASLLTGKHYLKTGVFHVTRGGEKMHSTIETLAERLSKHGYENGLFGKWHNGLQYPHDPLGQGFDEFYGFSAGHLSEYYDNYLHHNDKRVKYEGYVADAITDKTIDFVNAHKDSPFFAMLSFNTPHGPFQSPEKLFNKYKSQGLEDVTASVYAMVENIDQNVGRVIDTLKQNGQYENTIILYTSDNGPAFPGGFTRYNADLKGHKGLVDEGGVRSPLALYWPKGDLPKHTVMPITQHIDIMPTLLSLAGISFDEGEFDGKDLSPLMRKSTEDWPQRTLYSHRFRISKDASKNPIELTPAAIRTQQYLAMAGEGQAWQLYDLQADPGQKKDLSELKPDVLEGLKQQFQTWHADITAQYGPYKTIPIELGHEGKDTIVLPAHEALIENALDYQHGAGWSHDWLIATSSNLGVAMWPLKAVSAGEYQVFLHYATGEQGYSDKLKVSLDEQTLVSSDLPTFLPETLSTARQYYTDEAPDLTWNTLLMGSLSISQQESALKVAFNKTSPESEVWVKQITLVRQN